ncbi:MAG TPA: hypothetical protein VKA37_05845 [Halobacteriales archaeon]|nr:hypothetical protein [Halobacteriales archaeon]
MHENVDTRYKRVIRNKLQRNAVAGRLFTRMAPQHHADDRRSATESKFYLPAAVTSTIVSGRFERLWSSLFDHRVGPSR